jgi:hypothetical protein
MIRGKASIAGVAAVMPALLAVFAMPAFAQNNMSSQDNGYVRQQDNGFSQRQDNGDTQSDNTPRVIVNSSRVRFEGQPPIEQDGHVLVPLRGILEKMGAYVDFDSSTQTVVAYQGNTHLSLPIGRRTATVNGQSVPLDVPAQVINGSTMVPLRFVAETLGANVAFDSDSNTVRIDSSGMGTSASAELPPDRSWRHDHDNNRDQSAGNDQARPNEFRGEFSSFIHEGENSFLIRTQDGRAIRILKSSPVYWQGQKISVDDLRPGDHLTIALDPDTHTGMRVLVNR